MTFRTFAKKFRKKASEWGNSGEKMWERRRQGRLFGEQLPGNPHPNLDRER